MCHRILDGKLSFFESQENDIAYSTNSLDSTEISARLRHVLEHHFGPLSKLKSPLAPEFGKKFKNDSTYHKEETLGSILRGI